MKLTSDEKHLLYKTLEERRIYHEGKNKGIADIYASLISKLFTILQ